MTPEEAKRNVLVREIEWWRQSRLLPESYCDFLLNLYLNEPGKRSRFGSAVRRIGNAAPLKWVYVFAIFSLICFVFLYFSFFSSTLQIAIAAAATAGLLALAVWRRQRAPGGARFALGAAMFVPLVAGFAVLDSGGWLNPAGMAVLFGICAVIWIACGVAFRMALLQTGGLLLAMGAYALLLAGRLDEPAWFEVQLCWMPLSVLFIWLSWFLHDRVPGSGAALFAAALVAWYVPEIYSVLANADRPLVETRFLAKTALLGLGLFRLRRHWTEWVA
jgi:hypothetical protein